MSSKKRRAYSEDFKKQMVALYKSGNSLVLAYKAERLNIEFLNQLQYT